MPKLHEYDKEEWWNVICRLRPDIDRIKFEQDWAEFCELKRKKNLN